MMWLKLAFALGVVGGLVYGQTDRTVEPEATGSAVVDAVVDRIQVSCIFDNDRVFLRRLALVETRDGADPNTYRSGYDGGIWQVDETSFKNTQKTSSNSKLSDMFTQIEEEFGIKWKSVSWSDLRKPLYSGLAARLKLVVLNRVIPWSVDAQATFWKDYYTNNNNLGVQDFKNVVGIFETVCDVPKADIAFVLDESGSIGSGNYDTMKSFVNSVVESFDVASNKVRIGLITYSSDSRLKFNPNKYNTKAKVKNAVSGIGYAGGGTFTYKGLNDLRTMMSTYGRNAEAAPRVGIVLTDGKSNSFTQTNSSAQLVKDDGTTVFAVGVTSGINQQELIAIASEPTCLHKFELASFSDVTHFTNEIMRRSCKASAEVSVPASFFGILKTGQYQYFASYFGDAPGLRFKLKMKSGSAKLIISYTIPNPSEALYDYLLDVDSTHTDGKIIYVPKPNKIKIKVKVKVKVFLALVGTGVGMPNDYGMTSDESSGAQVVFSVTALLAGLMAAIFS